MPVEDASAPARYAQATRALRAIDDDWRRAVDLIGPCGHEPKVAREPWEALVRAIAYQQLTARAGDAILARLSAAAGGAFSDPALIVTLGTEGLRRCGFSASKANTVIAIGEGAITGLVPARQEAATLGDKKLIRRLTNIRGIGRWTVEMLLIYSLGREDVLPADDFGAREGYRHLRGLDQQPTPRALRMLAEHWAPYRTVATWYLWRLAERAKRKAPEPATAIVGGTDGH